MIRNWSETPKREFPTKQTFLPKKYVLFLTNKEQDIYVYLPQPSNPKEQLIICFSSTSRDGR